MIKTVISNMSVDQLILIFILSNKHIIFKYMLDILKSEGSFVIKFVALTFKLYLCIAIISKEGHKRIIIGVVQNYSCILFRSLDSVQKETEVPV